MHHRFPSRRSRFLFVEKVDGEAQLGGSAKIQSGAASPHSKVASQIVTAVRQVETFVAQREVGNLLVAQCHRQPRPVVK